MTKDQAPAAASGESDYKPKPIELGKKIVIDKTTGMPKSKKPWKQGSKRSGIQKKFSPKTWQEKTEERKRLKALKDRLKEAEEKKKLEVGIFLVFYSFSIEETKVRSD